MDQVKIKEENLRQAACEGNETLVKELIKSGVNVNSQNSINGWTALHWAAKRGHSNIVQLLCEAGAVKDIFATNNLSPCDVAANDNVYSLLCASDTKLEKVLKSPKTALSFTPNYLSHPVFPYGSPQAAESSGKYATEKLPNNAAPSHEPVFLYQPTHCHVVGSNQHCPTGQIVIPEEIVLKVRTDSHYSTASDFVEVSLNRKKSVSLSELIALLCQYVEYELSPKEVVRIRKLPNTILKSDDDIRRLTDYQELELVLLPKSS